MSSENDEEACPSAGIFTALLGSAKANVDERLKSPFAGAFLVSRVADNWQALLLSIFSRRSVEWRIECLKKFYFSSPTAL